MILGIGIDVVHVDRFVRWNDYPPHRLYRVFSEQEITDCRDTNGALVPEKLAIRFAAKEAFYKALSSALVNLELQFKPFALLAVCRFIEVLYGAHGVPILHVEWKSLQGLGQFQLPKTISHLSMSHEKHCAVTMVLIEQNDFEGLANIAADPK